MRLSHGVTLFLIGLFGTSCEVEGPAGLNSLVNLGVEQPGSNCVSGGVKIESGLDANRDESLGSDEVTQIKYVCNGVDGANRSITTIGTEGPGSNCLYGGVKVATGIDLDLNENLEPGEIKTTQYICAAGTDKQIRLPFPSGASTRSTSYVISDQQIPQAQYLVKFNKLNYADVGSITFGVTITSLIDPMFPGQSNTAFVELFNVTDNVAIANSELQLTANGVTQTAFLETGNLLASLPTKEIELVIRIRTSNSNHVASAASPYIFVYRN